MVGFQLKPSTRDDYIFIQENVSCVQIYDGNEIHLFT